MSYWIAGAAVVGAVVGAEGSKDSADTAADASGKSLGFEEQKYKDWKAVYGDIQTNLGNYYNTLTPDTYAARGIQEFKKSNEAELEKINTTLAQKGLLNSGTEAAVVLASGLNAAEKKATIRATADEVVAGEQSRFLQIGLGQNPGASYSQVLANQATQANNRAAQDSATAGKAIGKAVTTVGTGLSDYFNKTGQDTNKTPSYTGDVVTNTNVEYLS